MTFNPNVPVATQSPGLFPPQNAANFTRLQTIIETDHQFNNTGPTADGFHKRVSLIVTAAPIPPTLPTGADALLYAFIDNAGQTQLAFLNGTNNFQLTPSIIRACVNFSNSGTIRSGFNVASVTKNGTGDYTINFTNPMPDTNYIVQITGQRVDVADVCIGCITGGPSFSAEATVNSLNVNFFGSSTTLREITTGCVTIVSVT